ncbi:MAG: SBBP repeat-containing protein [Bacteroidota bacterium]
MTAIAIFGFATITMAQNVRAWGTYYTGTGQVWPNGEERGNSCIADAAGNVYMVGFTSSISDIATAGAHQTVYAGGPIVFGTGGYDAFLVKFNSSGVRQWATYYGGSQDDMGISCAVDASGNVYMIGSTSSTSGIATAGAHETTINDGFLVKFNSNGVRQWGTYFEGNGNACTTDDSGNIYIVGLTNSTSGIATAGAHQTVMSGSGDAFLVKFNSSGVKQWGTYFGGASSGASGMEKGISCATDALGNVYMVGQTPSTSGIATTGAHQTIYGGGSCDAFLVKFNSSGVMQWGTYYGGAGVDIGYSCATDATGNVYLAGDTQQEFLPASSGMTTIGAHQSAYGGGYSDGFLVKFDSNGLRQWGTYYGGSLLDVSFSCATDASGNVYMSGNTQSSAGIATSGAHQTTLNDAFLVSFNSSGVRQSGTYYGGIKNVCTSDASGNVYMTGYTQSNSDIATAGAHQTANGNNGYSDAFLVKFSGISVGINETINDKLFSIYPNPTQSIVNVKADTKLIGAVYNIYDNTGKVVLSGKINTENTSVDLEKLAAGIYLFSIGENVKQTFKVIKE